VDVTNQREQILIHIDKHCVMATLEQMTRSGQVTLNSSRIDARNPKHHSPQRGIADLHEHVDVIRHPAIRMHTSRIPFDRFGHRIIEPIAMRITKKDVVTMIATQRHMIESPRRMYSQRSSHPCPSLFMNE
jgi:hypothetical protein